MHQKPISRINMSAKTNKLVTRSAKVILPAAVGAAVLGSALFFHQGDVHASAISAAPLDDRSVSALSALDHDMEALAARVTPAVVNVAVTSRGGGEEDQQEGGQLQDLPPGLRAVFRCPWTWTAATAATATAAAAWGGERRHHFARWLHSSRIIMWSKVRRRFV